MDYFCIAYDRDFETPIAVTIDYNLAADIIIEMLIKEGVLDPENKGMQSYDGAHIQEVNESELRSTINLTDEDMTKILEDHALFL